MADEKSKQLAPVVVLAQHGNKGAYRDIYKKYFKNIFFLCGSMTDDMSLAAKLTAEIFIKMFSTVDKLSDHMAFEQWFYSLAINVCRQHTAEKAEGGVINENIVLIAERAVEAAKEKDRFAFEQNVMKIIEEMILCLPGEARVIFFYSKFASLDAEKISLLEKIPAEDIEAQINAVDILIEKQTEKIRELGVDVSMFMNNCENTLTHLVNKTFVPVSVHDEVSAAIGTDVNPFVNEKPQKEKPEAVKTEEKIEKKKVKKNFLTKGDIILFFAVIAAVLLIFSAVHIYRSAKDEKNTTTSARTESQERPVLLWNGAAASSFESGSGTKADPYIIMNGGQLAYLANLVNDGASYYSSCYYRLGNDILLNDTENFDAWGVNPPKNKWLPIGYDDSENGFTGTFDGADHTISGMYVQSDGASAGLFGKIKNGTVKNLTVKESYVQGGSYTGGIAGYFVSDASSGGFDYCGFSGTVRGTDGVTGGIAGFFSSSGEGIQSINGCYSSGLVSSENGIAGGIIGECVAGAGTVRIIDCLNTSAVSAVTSGGIAGFFRASDGNNLMLNCVNSGAVTGENSGGFSGLAKSENGSGTVNISFCAMLDSSAKTDVIRGEGGEKIIVSDCLRLTADQMTEQNNFYKFNFDEIWTFDADSSYKYPILQNMEFFYAENIANIENESEIST